MAVYTVRATLLDPVLWEVGHIDQISLGKLIDTLYSNDYDNNIVNTIRPEWAICYSQC